MSADLTLKSEDGQYECGSTHAVDVAYTVSCVEATIMQADFLRDSSVRGDAMDYLMRYLRGDLSGEELRGLVEGLEAEAKVGPRMVVEIDKQRRVAVRAPERGSEGF